MGVCSNYDVFSIQNRKFIDKDMVSSAHNKFWGRAHVLVYAEQKVAALGVRQFVARCDFLYECLTEKIIVVEFVVIGLHSVLFLLQMLVESSQKLRVFDSFRNFGCIFQAVADNRF